MSEYDTADMKNLHYHAFNYRNAHSTQAGNDFNTLEEFVSKMCIAASGRWRDEWSEQCNENQILHNTCDESLAFGKELTKERDALADALRGLLDFGTSVNSNLVGDRYAAAHKALATLRHNVMYTAKHAGYSGRCGINWARIPPESGLQP